MARRSVDGALARNNLVVFMIGSIYDRIMVRRAKKRYTILDDFDDALVSLALEDAYPGIVFTNAGQPMLEPSLPIRPSFAECHSVAEAYFAEPGWQPRFERNERNPKWFEVTNLPKRALGYDRSRWFWGQWGVSEERWAFSLPSPGEGALWVRASVDTKEDRSFVRSLHNLLEALMTNRLKAGMARDRFVSTEDVGGGLYWAGHHVLEWCRAEPRRMLNGTLLPCDDWEAPDTPWYRDLRQRVVARYGPDFGEPTPPGASSGPGAAFVGS